MKVTLRQLRKILKEEIESRKIEAGESLDTSENFENSSTPSVNKKENTVKK